MKRYLSIGLCIALLTCLLGINVSASSTYESYEAGSIPEYGVYMLRNCGSGKFLNVHNGVNADGTNVYQWTQDGSVEQRFSFYYTAVPNSPAGYYIGAMCSSNGANRRLTVTRSNGSFVNGSNLEINSKTTDGSQLFVIESAGPQRVYLRLYAQPDLALGAGDNNNGTAAGTSATSAGNVCLQTYTGSDYQKWELVPVNPMPTIYNREYYIKSAYSDKYLTVSGDNVIQSSYTGGTTQKWTATYMGGGFYELTPASNPTCRLDVAQGGDGDGCNIGIYQDNDTAAQRFRILPNGDMSDNTYRIAPQCSATRVVDIHGPSTDDGTNIHTWKYKGEIQQKWIFVPVPGSTTAGPYELLGWEWVFDAYEHTNLSRGYSNPGHLGLDVWDSTISNAIIYSPTEGVVQDNFYESSAGNYVVIKTDHVDTNGVNIRVGFMHLVERSTLQPGERVTITTIVGKVGSTGNSSGPHLHLATWNGSARWAYSETAINPQRFYPEIDFTS